MVALGNGFMPFPLLRCFPGSGFLRRVAARRTVGRVFMARLSAALLRAAFWALELVCEGSGKGERWKPPSAEEVQ